MLIHLIRHGQVDGPPALYGRTDIALSEEGRECLLKATGQLPQPDRIVSSPLQRCHRFAQERARALQTPLLTLPSLAEMNFGDWDGIAYDQNGPHWQAMLKFWHNPASQTPPNGESLSAMRLRVLHAWHTLSDLQDEHVWVLCHGGVIRLLLAEILQLDWRNPHWYSQLSLGYASRSTIRLRQHDGITHAQVSAIGIPPYP